MSVMSVSLNVPSAMLALASYKTNSTELAIIPCIVFTLACHGMAATYMSNIFIPIPTTGTRVPGSCYRWWSMQKTSREPGGRVTLLFFVVVGSCRVFAIPRVLQYELNKGVHSVPFLLRLARVI